MGEVGYASAERVGQESGFAQGPVQRCATKLGFAGAILEILSVDKKLGF